MIDYKEITIRVPRESCEALDRVIDLVKTIKEEGEDGWDFSDIPVITQKAISAVSEISDLDQMQYELSADPQASYELFALAGARIFSVLLD